MGEFAVETMADFRLPIVDFRSILRERRNHQERNLSTGVRNTIFWIFRTVWAGFARSRRTAWSSAILNALMTAETLSVRKPEGQLNLVFRQAAWSSSSLISRPEIFFHLYFNNRYGYFRDEFDYIICGRHLAWDTSINRR